MKTSEFIKRVEELGYQTEIMHGAVHVSGSTYVYTHSPYRMCATEIGYNDPKLLDLMVEYAKTPIEDREEPKRYRLRLPETTNKERYLQIAISNQENYKFGKGSSTNYFIAEFTNEQLESINDMPIVKALIKEEIK